MNSFRITLTLKSGGRDFELNFDPSISANQHLVTGLEPNTTYTVMAALGNANGGGRPKMFDVTTPRGQSHLLLIF